MRFLYHDNPDLSISKCVNIEIVKCAAPLRPRLPLHLLAVAFMASRVHGQSRSWPVLRRVIDAQNFDGIICHPIDRDVGEWGEDEFTGAGDPAIPSAVREQLQPMERS